MAHTTLLKDRPTTHPLPPRKKVWPFLVLLFVITAVYFGSSFTPVLFDETEGQYAGAAREMLRSGDWLAPTNDGMPRLQKPPLLYWLLCASFVVFGRNEFAARLPNTLATIGWVWAVYLLGQRLGGRRRGI